MPFKKDDENINRNGRPKDSFSLITLLKQELQKCPKGKDKKTYARIMVKKMIDEAVEKGDDQKLKLIFNYTEGLPKQVIDHTTKGDKIENKTFIQINSMDEKTIDDEFQKKLNSQNDE